MTDKPPRVIGKIIWRADSADPSRIAALVDFANKTSTQLEWKITDDIDFPSLSDCEEDYIFVAIEERAKS